MGRRIKHTSRDVEELARLMLAEAIGEGVQGMNMVGTVVANRVEADCAPDFKGLRNIRHAIYQTIPGTRYSSLRACLKWNIVYTTSQRS